MLTRQVKIYIGITAIVMAVILLSVGLSKYFEKDVEPLEEENIVVNEDKLRHPLNGSIITDDDLNFFAVSVAIDNAYNIRPQKGLYAADIIYEALAESNITRLLAVFDSRTDLDKVGPVRSARNYFMDWAEEYGGIYMHVGGSPQALAVINDYNFINVDQIGAGEGYFWRDDNIAMPHNVFTSSANWLRAGEIREVGNINKSITWHFVDKTESDNIPPDLTINFSTDVYKAEWRYNAARQAYQRFQNEEKYLYNTGEQVIADNIIVQVVNSYLIDEERRGMDTHDSGQVYIFNTLGEQEGEWCFEDGRTRFYDEEGNELNLVPGKTWVEIVNDIDDLVLSSE